jgi:hypothetical protein
MHTANHVRVIPNILLHINVSKDHYSFFNSQRRIALRIRILLECLTKEDVGMTVLKKKKVTMHPTTQCHIPEDWNNKVHTAQSIYTFLSFQSLYIVDSFPLNKQ